MTLYYIYQKSISLALDSRNFKQAKPSQGLYQAWSLWCIQSPQDYGRRRVENCLQNLLQFFQVSYDVFLSCKWPHVFPECYQSHPPRTHIYLLYCLHWGHLNLLLITQRSPGRCQENPLTTYWCRQLLECLEVVIQCHQHQVPGIYHVSWQD